jgi:hypothetical protein
MPFSKTYFYLFLMCCQPFNLKGDGPRPSEGKFICPFCESAFSKKVQYFVNHLNQNHLKDLPPPPSLLEELKSNDLFPMPQSLP